MIVETDLKSCVNVKIERIIQTTGSLIKFTFYDRRKEQPFEVEYTVNEIYELFKIVTLISGYAFWDQDE